MLVFDTNKEIERCNACQYSPVEQCHCECLEEFWEKNPELKVD